MPTAKSLSLRGSCLMAGAVLLGSTVPALAAAPAAAIARLEVAAGTPLRVTRAHGSDRAVFVAPRSGVIALPEAAGATAEARAHFFAAANADTFGAAEGSEFRTVRTSGLDAVGQEHVRLQQVFKGVPVAGGELVVHLRAKGVRAANGRSLGDLGSIDVSPSVKGGSAAAVARDTVAAKLAARNLVASEPRLEIFNQHFLTGMPGSSRSALAWFVEVRGQGVRQYVWIDAHTGKLLLEFSQLPSARNRQVYTSNDTATLPGTLARSEGAGPTADADVNAAYDFSGSTYDYFFTQHGRDSYDGAGAALISSVNYCETTCPYQNAFWDGTQMVYGDGMSLADDVDAHELTHAVTERTANLFYYMQSGALNESYSDIFGETVDLGNGAGTDTSGVRWQLGEDLPAAIGVIRNMSDPTVFGDPGRMGDSANFKCDPYSDGGGVHSNSGIGNHAYALMVDGGTYNGRTVTGIGTTKAGKIQYRALTVYLVSGSNFLDNYNALYESCIDLQGTAGITSADCTEVFDAIEAVEMDAPPPCTAPAAFPIPDMCAVGGVLSTLYDNFEAGIGNWTTGATQGANAWISDVGYSTSGTKLMYGDDAAIVTDSTATMASGVVIPASASLQFNHAFRFDNFGGVAYDGGVLEYTTNNGASWIDAAPLMTAGTLYNSTVESGFGNPLATRSAWGFYTYGYTGTQLDLASLAGQTVKFRFRIGADDSFSDFGWAIDDFRIYTCTTPPAGDLSIADTSVAETNATVTATFTVTLSAAGTSNVTVNWATGAIGGATSGADYTAATGSLTFTPGQTSKTLSVAVLGDLTDEGPEYFYVNLSAPTGAVIADGQARGLISDDDPAPVIAFGGAAEPVNTEGDASITPQTFTVTLTGPTERTVDVTFATGTAGTATSGVDYEPKTGSLRFTPGQTSKEFVVRLSGDTTDEPRETYYVNLSNPLNATIGDTQAMGTIVDNDPTPAGSPNLSIGNATVLEGDTGTTTATFTVTLSAPASTAVTFTYGTGAGGTATSGVDYVGFVLKTATIGVGQSSKTVTVTVNNDNTNEANETFFVNVTSASNAAIVDGQGQGTITNDDAP